LLDSILSSFFLLSFTKVVSRKADTPSKGCSVDGDASLFAAFVLCFRKDKWMNILTADEVARLLRITKTTIYNLAAKGKISGFRVGNSWRFDIDEIIRESRAANGIALAKGREKRTMKRSKKRGKIEELTAIETI
jgi:excisionase family DNA binding protein